MSDVIRASAPPHVVEASDETSNSAFLAALIISIEWLGVSFARGYFFSWHVIIGGAPNFNLYRLKSDEEFAAEAAASTPVSEFIPATRRATRKCAPA
jgi:hypothetical protein